MFLPGLLVADGRSGYKMLKPNGVVTRCGRSGWTNDHEPALTQAAFQQLLSGDEEANALSNATLQWTGWSVGFYGKQCVTLRGDVVRSATTILLPMGEGHGGHDTH
jgi:hypothetical protein